MIQFTSVYTHESWGPSAGGNQTPPCDNRHNACPGKPQNCEPLDVTQSYEGCSKTVDTWTSADEHVMGACGSWAETASRLLDHRTQISGRLNSIFNGCSVLTAPQDFTSQTPFGFRRCAGGGWDFFTGPNQDGIWSFCDGHNCGGLPNCDARNCNGARVLQDMLCALRPSDCYVDEVTADSGCVQVRGNNDLFCEMTRDTFFLNYNIRRAGL